MKCLFSGFMVAFWVVGSALRADADTVFYDGTFNSSDWTSIQQYGNGSLVTGQAVSGGSPGSYFTVEHASFTGNFVAYHLKSGAVYDPGVAPIDRIIWSQDALSLKELYGIGVAVSPAVRQNGVLYAVFPQVVSSGSYWQPFSSSSAGYTAADFIEYYPAAYNHPDFSSSGGILEFGFCTSNNNINNLVSRAAGYDNWSLTLQTTVTPEPASSLLFLVGGGAVALVRRRRWFPGA